MGWILVRLYSLSELPRGPRDRIYFIQLSPHSVDMTVVASIFLQNSSHLGLTTVTALRLRQPRAGSWSVRQPRSMRRTWNLIVCLPNTWIKMPTIEMEKHSCFPFFVFVSDKSQVLIFCEHRDLTRNPFLFHMRNPLQWVLNPKLGTFGQRTA